MHDYSIDDDNHRAGPHNGETWMLHDIQGWVWRYPVSGDSLVAIGYRAGIADAARACTDRAERHAQMAERMMPGTAAIEFMTLRGEATACEREVRALTEGGN